LHRLDEQCPDFIPRRRRDSSDVVQIIEASELGLSRESRFERFAEIFSPGAIEGTQGKSVIGALEGEDAGTPAC
jgi:hypothetical protein